MALDFSSLEKATSQLQKSLSYYHSDLAQQDAGIRKQFQMAAIQAFEFTYELSYKTLKRYLETTEAHTGEIDLLSFPTLIRMGCERGLLKSDWSVWKNFREMRNLTSHTYDDEKANLAFSVLANFLQEASFLLHTLQGKNRDE